MLVFKKTFVNIHIALEHNQPNTNHKVCLGFTHLFMKKFVTLFKFK